MILSRTILRDADNQEGYWHGVFKRTFSTADGKIALLKILSDSGIFTHSNSHGEHANWVDGRRSLALEILETVQVDPLDVVIAGQGAQDQLEDLING